MVHCKHLSMILLSIFALTYITHIQSTSSAQSKSIYAEIQFGELVDKMTILRLKELHIQDEKKLRNVRTELDSLQETLNTSVEITPELEALTQELFDVNKKLWDIEDAIREKEDRKEFDDEFIALARSVYITNDKRCEIKRAINLLLDSRLIEEKSYKKYSIDTVTDLPKTTTEELPCEQPATNPAP